MYRLLCCFSAVVVAFAVLPCGAQVRALDSIPPIPFFTTGPVIQAHAEPEKPFTVAGERGVVVGQQDGSFESWVLPVKLLSHLSIEAEIEGYTVPIDVNRQAAEVEVRPDRTVITYAHIGFTVRQIMFSPSQGPAGTGPVVLFEFDCVRPTDFTLRFTPEMRRVGRWGGGRILRAAHRLSRAGRRGDHARRAARHPGALSGAAPSPPCRAEAAH
jgi:hypothetical protein